MKQVILFLIVIIISGISEAQAKDPQDGYAIVRSDTIFGKVEINFDRGSVMIYQDSVNRFFTSNIELVTLLTEDREVFLPISDEKHTTFYRLLVHGKNPLLELNGSLHSIYDHEVVPLVDEKTIYELFGKKRVKEYVFVRNLDIATRAGLLDVFRYFNDQY